MKGDLRKVADGTGAGKAMFLVLFQPLIDRGKKRFLTANLDLNARAGRARRPTFLHLFSVRLFHVVFDLLAKLGEG
ncbi:MAG: hypothetical protein WAK55_22630, partial [Xanthobacteraceae bacterium]